ncbi:E3 ubiquitin-protein ligase rad18 [Coemansia brasiliensis]|uniref:Postreplication repair E3 ubiquitin-protein ligase RAD18 n=1 Tax=Coemansia brasiliensis TaxID=2650707 RepID=A0A9W8LVS3_9FUNG|nr:E3 ubiquitin-protein ligase rad18 [Coemansia brasiliensis]
MLIEETLEDPTDWPQDYVHLRHLDQQLRCPICKEYFVTAMAATECGHTFCSLCVRRCLSQESKCPSCRAPLTEGELFPNRLVDSLMRTFRSGRQQLLDTLTAKPEHMNLNSDDYCKRCHTKKENNDEQRKRPRVCTRSMRKADGKVDLTMPGVENITASDIEEMLKDEDSDFEPASNGNTTQKPNSLLAAANSVTCPNCKLPVTQSQINRHLDQCLSGKSTKPTVESMKKQFATAKPNKPIFMLNSQPAKFTLPRPTKLAYSLLSESKLRRTLKELGIPAKGDKQQMQARHIEWVNMYMANADSEIPVSHKVLLKRLAAWEEALGRQADKLDSTADSQEDHATKYADSFAELVAQAQANRKSLQSQ